MSQSSHISDREAIYNAVGRALDAWTQIEIELEPLFAALASADEIRGAIAMASLVSFKAEYKCAII